MLVLNIIFLLLSHLIENSRETHFLIETEDGNGAGVSAGGEDYQAEDYHGDIVPGSPKQNGHEPKPAVEEKPSRQALSFFTRINRDGPTPTPKPNGKKQKPTVKVGKTKMNGKESKPTVEVKTPLKLGTPKQNGKKQKPTPKYKGKKQKPTVEGKTKMDGKEPKLSVGKGKSKKNGKEPKPNGKAKDYELEPYRKPKIGYRPPPPPPATTPTSGMELITGVISVGSSYGGGGSGGSTSSYEPSSGGGGGPKYYGKAKDYELEPYGTPEPYGGSGYESPTTTSGGGGGGHGDHSTIGGVTWIGAGGSHPGSYESSSGGGGGGGGHGDQHTANIWIPEPKYFGKEAKPYGAAKDYELEPYGTPEPYGGYGSDPPPPPPPPPPAPPATTPTSITTSAGGGGGYGDHTTTWGTGNGEVTYAHIMPIYDENEELIGHEDMMPGDDGSGEQVDGGLSAPDSYEVSDQDGGSYESGGSYGSSSAPNL